MRGGAVLLEPNCVIVATRVGLGKAAINSRSVAINQDLRALRPTSAVTPEFLLFTILESIYSIRKFGQGTTVKGVTKDDLLATVIQVAPLLVQERIVEILQRAAAIRRKRIEFRRVIDEVLLSTFFDLFGALSPERSTFRTVRLGDVAAVKSGVTKGRALRGRQTVMAPYLRVANVQDGFLDLAEVKTLPVLPGDLEKFQLRDGDVLMTEGGDPDKLGRGCIWRGQVEGCIHQNHIFRVRADTTTLLPEFLAALLRTPHAKNYFRAAAKRSSNLASINSTQVNNFEFPLPPMELQRKFLLRVEHWDRAVNQATEAIHIAERTFAVLSAQGLVGNLTAEWEEANAAWINERQLFYERFPRLALLAVLFARRQQATSGISLRRLTKYMFLLEMKGDLRRPLYRFDAGLEGPWSRQLLEDLRVLEREGLVTIDGDDSLGGVALRDPVRIGKILTSEAEEEEVRVRGLDDPDGDISSVDFVTARLLARRREVMATLFAETESLLETWGDLEDEQLVGAMKDRFPSFFGRSAPRGQGA